ncbi:MAG: AAA family ATPase [Planctomyces sp.]
MSSSLTAPEACIELEGVRVNNLRQVSLRIRHESLTVICGLSGSGKSSLAFDTLYAEGQRRYVETFSPAARQFLERIERPAADRISGLPPAVAIHQSARGDGPRSTVGSRTEVLDALQILFAHAGTPHCPGCGIAVCRHSPATAVAALLQTVPGARLLLGFPLAKARGGPPATPEFWLQRGITRCLLNSRQTPLDQWPHGSPLPPDTIFIVDRLKADPTQSSRLEDSAATALQLADILLVLSDVQPAAPSVCVTVDDRPWHQIIYPFRLECAGCGTEFSDITPQHFSFNSPLGACPDCGGTGTAGDESSMQQCAGCSGTRLAAFPAAARYRGATLPEVCRLEAGALMSWLQMAEQELSNSDRHAITPAFRHALRRLDLLCRCGLEYLTLERSMKSLSGGEARRTLLVAALSSGLTGTLYVLDEPTQGLHPADTARVMTVIRELQQAGNTVVVVEHDPTVILAADEVIETGPGAGDDGGRIVFQGSPERLAQQDTATGRLLAGRHAQSGPAAGTPRLRDLRTPQHWLRLTDIHCRNLVGTDVEFPLGVLCGICGVSGSGKSSLMTETLYPHLLSRLQPGVRQQPVSSRVASISGTEHLESVLLMDQQPVRRSTRSIPATWLGIFDEIRALMADTHEARRRNLTRGMFSFNSSRGGRCPACEGRGQVTVPMQFLADIETVCEACGGRRFRPDVLEIRYRGRSIDEILQMSADEAFRFFHANYRIQTKLNALRQAGLSYLRLGQPLSVLSGGEAQRLRIAAMLAGVPQDLPDTPAGETTAAQLTNSGRTLFLFDEPSGGLHGNDVQNLVACLDFLVQTGHSVIIIDHDQELLSQADWLIELGPGPGARGGQVLHSGQPSAQGKGVELWRM